MSSGPEGESMLSPQGRIYDCICSDSCVMQASLDSVDGSIYDKVLKILETTA